MNHKQFNYVLTLAREGSFSKAADVLNISQPSLSQYIKKIEQQVGLELFDRANGEVRLTDAGRVYIEAGRKILDVEHQLEVQLSDLATHKTGSLVIGTAPYRASGMMPVVAKRFQQVYPGIHLIIREGTTAELAEAVERGECDLCLTMLPLDGRIFSYEKVAEEELILAVPASYKSFQTQAIAGLRYPAINVKDIDEHSFVMLTDSQFMQKQLQNLIMDYKLTLRIAAIVKSLSSQISMVREGVGMALVPSGIERFCSNKEVSFYSFAERLPKREAVVMWRKDRKLSVIENELKAIIKNSAL